ncbi:MAG TPA: gamma-glutamylcyclotransferase family protein [Bryobacteraceae bacterium]|nr:gamma-glutamylcyclotransferase family protein [Bryobacteraceae bacterium]
MSRAYLFVYGTLRRGSKNRFAGVLASQARFAGTGRISAELYDLGKYPGAVPSEVPGRQVEGDVFLLKTSGKMLRILDAYEGPQFQRSTTLVQLPSGRQIECWVYWWRGARARACRVYTRVSGNPGLIAARR